MKKKKIFNKIYGLCFKSFLVLMLLLPAGCEKNNFVFQENAKYIDKVISAQLKKDPNELYEKDFESIETLVLSGRKISTLEPLTKLKNLQTLTLHSTCYDLEPLSKLKKLRALGIVDPGYTIQTKGLELSAFDAKQLEKLNQLEHLGIVNTDVYNISSISKLKNLKMLHFDGVIAIDSNGEPIKTPMDFLKDLKRLESLEIYFMRIEDIKPISGLKNLKHIDLWTDINDIEPLKKLKNLESLYIRNKYFGDEQIAELQKALPNLEIIK